MTDIVDRSLRSRMMAAVGRADTGPEQIVRRCLRRLRVRYSSQGRGLPGTPDFVLGQPRVALFVHGCFWHRHRGCRLATTPATRARFWAKKFADNVVRDRRATWRLRHAGWRVWVVWQCQTRPAADLERRLRARVRRASMPAAYGRGLAAAL